MGTDGGAKRGPWQMRERMKDAEKERVGEDNERGYKWVMDNRKKEFGKKRGVREMIAVNSLCIMQGKRDEEEQQEKRDTHPWLFSITCDAVSLLLWQRGEEKQINLNRMPKGLILWTCAQRKKKSQREKTKNIRQRYQRRSSVRAARRISPGHMHKCKTTC